MAKRLGQSFYKTPGLVRCSWYAVEGPGDRIRDTQGSVMCMSTVGLIPQQMTEKSWCWWWQRGVRTHSGHHSLLCLMPWSWRVLRMRTSEHHRELLQWACEHQSWTMRQWEKVCLGLLSCWNAQLCALCSEGSVEDILRFICFLQCTSSTNRSWC